MKDNLVNKSGGLVNDCISRQAALDALGERPVVWSDKDDYALGERNQYDMDRLAIETVPPAQPGWIPCKTALPDDDTEVIVSCTDDSGDYDYSYVTTGWHYRGLWVVNNDRCYFVRAWQPLPAKPWEGGQDGTD